ncbi:MAG: hypothetical protein U1E39_06235 [Planctomycetota bacterium]
MNRRLITRTTFATLAALAPVAAIRPAHAADAPPAPAAANDVAAIAAGLEAPEAAARAKAAETLGARYPEAAVAVPVLLDATRDEDAAARTAAVRALRLLGRRGQEDAAKAWTTMPAADLALLDEALRVVAALGPAAMPLDLAHLLIEACGARPEATGSALQLLAMLPVRTPDREFSLRVTQRDGLETIAVGLPFLASTDARIARAAAAVVTILGRSAVAAPFGAAPEDDTASAKALVDLLGAPAPAVRLAGWRLLACGAPHSFRTAMTVVKQATGLAAGTSVPSELPPGPIEIDRRTGDAAARSLGPPAVTYLTEGRQAGDREDDVQLRTWLEVGARNLVRDAWRAALSTWIGARHERSTDPSVVFAIGQDAEMASMAAKSLPRLLDTERSEHETSRNLLQPVDPSAPTEPVPQETEAEWAPHADPNRANPCLSLAWLSHRVPEAEVDKGLRARTAGALRRALVTPNRLADRRTAAAILVDLGKPNLVPPATLIAALDAPGTKADAFVETAVVAALAVGPLPDAGVARLAPLATKPAAQPTVKPDDRARAGALFPLLQPALALESEGSWVELPALRRLAAIDALGAVAGDKAKAKEVLAPLTKDPDARVRYRAAKALRRLGA